MQKLSTTPYPVPERESEWRVKPLSLILDHVDTWEQPTERGESSLNMGIIGILVL